MATGYVEISPATDDAPFALKATLTATGGSWPTATYSFLLIAWDDPQEQDPEQARFLNNAWGVTPATASGLGPAVIDGVTTGAGDNDIVTISWTPPRRRPDHYALYVQQAATYDLTNPGTRLTPEGTTQNGYIPGWATSVALTAKTNFLETRSARIKTINTNTSYVVYGNHALYLYQGASVNAYDGDGGSGVTAHTLDGGFPDLAIDTGGADTITTAYEGATRSTANWLQYELGLFKLETGTGLSLNAGVRLSLLTDMQAETRQSQGRDYNGRNVPLAYTTDDEITKIVFQCTHGGIAQIVSGAWTESSAAAGLATLHRWRRNRIPLLFTITTSGSQSNLNIARGVIQDINEWGHSHVQGNQRIEITVDIDRTYNSFQSAPLKRYAISAVQTSPGRFTIDGDHRKDFPEGAKLFVRGSTGNTNSAFFAVSSTELSSGNTRIYVTTTPVAGMADATLELIDVP